MGVGVTAPGVAAPPKGLRTSGRRLWKSVAADYELDVHEELLLLQACRCADRLDLLATEADSALTVVNMKGDQVTHPAITESRQQALTLSLRLPSGEAGAELVRPQRRGASRAPYGIRGAVS